MICNYTANYYKDEDLWAMFHNDFEGFSQEIFAQADKRALQHLCSFLVTNGVWVNNPIGGTYTYSKVIFDCLQEKTPTKWDNEKLEIAQQLKDKLEIDYLLKQSQPTNQLLTNQILTNQVPLNI
jgi:hypothetical protein